MCLPVPKVLHKVVDVYLQVGTSTTLWSTILDMLREVIAGKVIYGLCQLLDPQILFELRVHVFRRI